MKFLSKEQMDSLVKSGLQINDKNGSSELECLNGKTKLYTTAVGEVEKIFNDRVRYSSADLLELLPKIIVTEVYGLKLVVYRLIVSNSISVGNGKLKIFGEYKSEDSAPDLISVSREYDEGESSDKYLLEVLYELMKFYLDHKSEFYKIVK